MNKILRIAVIKSGAVGDLIMTTPALKSLRTVYPNAVIDLFCGAEYLHVLNNNPNITNIYPISLTDIFHGSLRQKIREAKRIIDSLEGYDISYTLNTDKRWHALSFFAGIPERYGCAFSDTLFTNNAYICSDDEHRATVWVNTAMHTALRGNASMAYEFFPDECNIPLPVRKYISIAAGGGNNVKARYPQKIWDKYGELTERILSETDFDIALLGNAEDRIQTPRTDRITDYTGRTSLSDCFAIINNAERFIGNDSGLMHLAACTNTPITAIYGATNFMHTRPYNNPKNRVVMSSLGCSPCEKKGKFGCASNNCMREISVDEVFEALGF